MQKRDPYNILCQHDTLNPGYLDGGDSCNRTSIMAICGSWQDRLLLSSFHIGNGYCVRHPYTSPHNTADTFTGDQAYCYIAALSHCKRFDIIKKFTLLILSRGCFLPNTHFHPSLIKKHFPHFPDFAHPGRIAFFIIAGRLWPLFPLALIGYPFLLIDLIWACFVRPMSEQNQYFCIFHATGLLSMYLKLNKRFDESMKAYWCGWRDQKEVYDAIMAVARKYQ